MRPIVNLLLLAAAALWLWLSGDYRGLFTALGWLLAWLQTVPTLFWWGLLLSFSLLQLLPRLELRTPGPLRSEAQNRQQAVQPLQKAIQAFSDGHYPQLSQSLMQEWLWSRNLPERALHDLLQHEPADVRERLLTLLNKPSSVRPATSSHAQVSTPVSGKSAAQVQHHAAEDYRLLQKLIEKDLHL